MNYLRCLILVLALAAFSGCVTTPATKTPTAGVQGSQDPNFIGSPTNAAIDKDEEELRLVP